MEHRITVSDAGVFIEIKDQTEGWMPLFGANSRGDFVGMPTCWPFLKAVSQEVCPTVVSMVFDVGECTVYWCENRQWEQIHRKQFTQRRRENDNIQDIN